MTLYPINANDWRNGAPWRFFEKTGAFRRPRMGEFYLSGAVPEAYRAQSEFIRDSYYILREVKGTLHGT